MNPGVSPKLAVVLFFLMLAGAQSDNEGNSFYFKIGRLKI